MSGNVLPGLGMVYYNGVSFNSTLDSSVSCDAVYDQAGRTIIYYLAKFIFTFELAAVTPGAAPTDPNYSTDAMMETLRKKLMQPAADFVYSGVGFGRLSVNPQASTPQGPADQDVDAFDVVWGPKPRRLFFEPDGANVSANVVWEVEIALLPCDDATYQRALLEFNFQMQWSITDGWTKRTYTGFLVIPATRKSVADRTLPDNADNYWEKVNLAVPTGYRRATYDRTIDYAKTRLTFTIVDEQVESTNYPPKGCVRVEASHTVESPGPGFLTWTGDIEGTYEAVRAVSPAQFFAEFQALVRDRLAALEKAASGGGPAGGALAGAAPPPAVSVIPTRLTMGEPAIYGRGRGRFRLSYTFTLTNADLAKAVALSGLWRPATNSNYDSWAKDMQDNRVWGPRGYSLLAFGNKDDVIIDLCLKKTVPVVPNEPGDKTNPPGFPKLLLITTAPPAERSFLDYHLELIALPRHATAELKPLPMQPVNIGLPKVAVDAQGGYRPPYAGSNPSTIQIRSNPSMVLTLRGRALRAGYSITPPQLTSLFGMTPVPMAGAGDYFSTSVAGAFLGLPVVRAAWQFTYLLPDVPPTGQGVTPPVNPIAGGPANAISLLGGGAAGGLKLIKKG